MYSKYKTESKNSTFSGAIFVSSLCIGCIFSLLIYWLKANFPFAEISAVGYIAMLIPISIYAWLGIILAYKYGLNYYMFSALIASEIVFKLLYAEAVISAQVASLGFTCVLGLGIFALSKKPLANLALILCIAFQLLLVRDCLFSYEQNPTWLFLAECLLLSFLAGLRQNTNQSSVKH